jgi:hypothetical protein
MRRTRWLLYLTLIRRLVLVLRRLAGSIMLSGGCVMGRGHPVNANLTYAFNIVIEVTLIIRLIVVA